MAGQSPSFEALLEEAQGGAGSRLAFKEADKLGGVKGHREIMKILKEQMQERVLISFKKEAGLMKREREGRLLELDWNWLRRSYRMQFLRDDGVLEDCPEILEKDIETVSLPSGRLKKLFEGFSGKTIALTVFEPVWDTAYRPFVGALQTARYSEGEDAWEVTLLTLEGRERRLRIDRTTIRDVREAGEGLFEKEAEDRRKYSPFVVQMKGGKIYFALRGVVNVLFKNPFGDEGFYEAGVIGRDTDFGRGLVLRGDFGGHWAVYENGESVLRLQEGWAKEGARYLRRFFEDVEEGLLQSVDRFLRQGYVKVYIYGKGDDPLKRVLVLKRRWGRHELAGLLADGREVFREAVEDPYFEERLLGLIKSDCIYDWGAERGGARQKERSLVPMRERFEKFVEEGARLAKWPRAVRFRFSNGKIRAVSVCA